MDRAGILRRDYHINKSHVFLFNSYIEDSPVSGAVRHLKNAKFILLLSKRNKGENIKQKLEC